MTSIVASPILFNPVQDLSPVLPGAAHPTLGRRGDRPKNNYATYILGTAFFDLNGLSQSWLNTAEALDVNWVKTTFEALRLQSLLGCWLKLQGMQHVTIRGNECNILLVRQCDRYVGLLIKHSAPDVAIRALLRWARTMQR
jgi:hypothetical protein